MSFIAENLKDITVGSNTFSQSLTFEDSPSGLVNYKSIKTDSKGISKEQSLQFYLCDIKPVVTLNVSTSTAEISIVTIDKTKYIKQTLDGNLMSYISSVKIYVDDIDAARNIINALEYSLKNSISGIQTFSNSDEAKEWLNQNIGEVIIDSKKIQQNITISSSEENKIEMKRITSSEGGSAINETYEIYPEDLTMENIVIKISGKKLTIPLSTGKLKYIKYHKDGVIQNFSTKAELLFDDIKTAKSFIAAISFMFENSQIEDRTLDDENIAFEYLNSNLKKVEVGNNIYEQKIEKIDDNICKLKYTLTKTDSKGVSIENAYEFMALDIDTENSSIAIYGKELKVSIVTNAKEKLIKPYKNGEAGNFIYKFDLYADDILTAKKLLAAFQSLSDICE